MSTTERATVSMADLIALQDASRRARSNYLLPGQTAAEERASWGRFNAAHKAYADALFAFMHQTGRGKLVYADIEAARQAQQGV